MPLLSSRRMFLAQSAVLLPIAKQSLTAKDVPTIPAVGVQLYTVRDVIEKDPVTVVKAIEQIGYTEVEMVYGSMKTVWPALEQTKLKAVSSHVDGAILTDDSKLDAALEDLKTKGFSYVVYPYLGKQQRGTADTYKKLAESFNHIGERAKASGLSFCYHNHAFEFQPMNGTTPLEILLGGTDKSLVSLEMDIFWVSVAGHDPAVLLKKIGDRVRLLHLKDKLKSVPTQYDEGVPHDTFKEVGSGSINISAVLAVANQVGVKHYFVEQDHTPGDPLASLGKSYKYLSQFLAKS